MSMRDCTQTLPSMEDVPTYMLFEGMFGSASGSRGLRGESVAVGFRECTDEGFWLVD